ncbi:hypothetical protein [Cupriavidus oxalaticus]|uniref:Beta-mannosidase n=1 Tax=Cupriavidus oxalaticus TaxID=96344 RepID=A0A375GKP9_9BURK|nr:hypothetical protein [Cupriavidus oxalaticus]QRQ84529.1 hypothetical protein JTE91_00015 [Cupriavidus oxalaticus]QRQ91382.1 hypothetical protein JTE92_12330 [Cupriavidus oxalaticus]WQD85942.1 hypothetical protein U0036_18085 [Cupriavidus oxalaticus]SPC19791.1 conserved hypothetical protein [Cupriavidus oxalaticus]
MTADAAVTGRPAAAPAPAPALVPLTGVTPITAVTDVAPRAPVGLWQWLQTLPGAAPSPAVLDDGACWLPAPVPGSVAMAMQAAGRLRAGAPMPLHCHDYWYRLRLAGHGPRLLRLRGLARGTEAWFNGRLVIAVDDAIGGAAGLDRLQELHGLHELYEAAIELSGMNTMHLCFRAPRVLHPAAVAARGWRCTVAAAGRLAGFLPCALPLNEVGPCQPVELLAPLTLFTSLPAPFVSAGRPALPPISDFCTRARRLPAPLPRAAR